MPTDAEVDAAVEALRAFPIHAGDPSHNPTDFLFVLARHALIAAEQVRDSAAGITTITFTDPPRLTICGNE